MDGLTDEEWDNLTTEEQFIENWRASLLARIKSLVGTFGHMNQFAGINRLCDFARAGAKSMQEQETGS